MKIFEMGVKMHKIIIKNLLIRILNIQILCWIPAGETTEQLPTDVNWTVLSYLIAHVLCLSPCVHPWLIRNFSYAINAVWSCQSRGEHALFQILNIQLCGVCKCVLPLNGDAPPSHLGHFPCPAQISPMYLSGLSVPIPEVRETVTLWCICFLLTCTSSSCLT